MRNIFTIFIKGRKNNELDLTEYSYAAADGETYGRRYFTGGKGGSATGGEGWFFLHGIRRLKGGYEFGEIERTSSFYIRIESYPVE